MASAEADADAAGSIAVEVAYSPGPGEVDRIALCLPIGCTVADALERSAIASRHPALRDAVVHAVGVWGRRCTPQQLLRDGDRVEVYRPLRVDPKEARRERQRRDDGGAVRRPAAKPRHDATVTRQPGVDVDAGQPATNSPTR